MPRRLFVRDQSYNTDQRVAQVRDYKHSAVQGDELTIDFTYASYVTGQVQGAELVGYEVWGPNNEKLRHVDLADHEAFGSPSTVTETGRSGAHRRLTYNYNAQGLVERTSKQVSAQASVVDEVTYNPCGLPDAVTDTEGRKLTARYDAACRRELVSFEGRRAAIWIRRVRAARPNVEAKRRLACPGNYSRYADGDVPHGSPHQASVMGDLAEFVYFDEWGRPLAEKRCRLDDAAAIGAGTRF